MFAKTTNFSLPLEIIQLFFPFLSLKFFAISVSFYLTLLAR